MAESRLRQEIRLLYTGSSQRATRFRYGLIAFDLASIAFFVITAPDFPTPYILIVDFVIGLVILADFLARLWIAPSKTRMLRQLYRSSMTSSIRSRAAAAHRATSSSPTARTSK